MGRGKKSGLFRGKKGKEGLKIELNALHGMQSPELHVVDEENKTKVVLWNGPAHTAT